MASQVDIEMLQDPLERALSGEEPVRGADYRYQGLPPGTPPFRPCDVSEGSRI